MMNAAGYRYNRNDRESDPGPRTNTDHAGGSEPVLARSHCRRGKRLLGREEGNLAREKRRAKEGDEAAQWASSGSFLREGQRRRLHLTLEKNPRVGPPRRITPLLTC